jgi:hypothetical protein
MSSVGGFGPGKLWSLWDMLEFDAYRFVGLMNTLQSITFNNRSPSPEMRAADTKMSRETFGKLLQENANHLAEMRLPTSKAAILDLKSWIVSHGQYNELTDEKVGFSCRVLRMETQGRKFIQVENEELYHRGAELFDSDMAVTFPSASYEVDEASKCLALERGTACVFHLMRALEIAVAATARCLQIPDPIRQRDRTWGAIQGKIDTAIKAKWPLKPDQENGDGYYFVNLLASFSAVKNPWRDATMHVEKVYTVEQARDILDAARGFMRLVMTRFDEQGQPYA